jgi:hypothetical protein
VLLSAEQERSLIVEALRKLGISQPDATSTADVLVEADLRGHGSHGLGRLRLVIERIQDGSVDPAGVPCIEDERPAALRINGNRSLGPPAVLLGLQEATRRARQQGTCSVAAYNHSYIAYLGRYVERCLEDDCVALLMSHALTVVHPYGGTARLLGTNPMAVAIPTLGDPLLIDFSTSATSAGKLQAAERAGRSVPGEWAIDEAGLPTTDPVAGLRGALSPMAGAKGYGLGPGAFAGADRRQSDGSRARRAVVVEQLRVRGLDRGLHGPGRVPHSRVSVPGLDQGFAGRARLLRDPVPGRARLPRPSRAAGFGHSDRRRGVAVGAQLPTSLKRGNVIDSLTSS